MPMRMIAKEWKSVRLPVGVAFETAATVWHNYGTAYYALVDGGTSRKPGETVFVTGAAGRGWPRPPSTSRAILGLRVIAGVGLRRQGRVWCAVTVPAMSSNYRSEGPARADQVDKPAEKASMFASTKRRRNDFRANGAADEVGWDG